MASAPDPMQSLLERLRSKDYPVSPPASSAKNFANMGQIAEDTTPDPSHISATEAAPTIPHTQSPPKSAFTFSFKENQPSEANGHHAEPSTESDQAIAASRPILEAHGPRTRASGSPSRHIPDIPDVSKSQLLKEVLRQSSPRPSQAGSRSPSRTSRHSSISQSHSMAASNELLSQLLGRPRTTSARRSPPSRHATPVQKPISEVNASRSPSHKSAAAPDHQRSLLAALSNDAQPVIGRKEKDAHDPTSQSHEAPQDQSTLAPVDHRAREHASPERDLENHVDQPVVHHPSHQASAETVATDSDSPTDMTTATNLPSKQAAVALKSANGGLGTESNLINGQDPFSSASASGSKVGSQSGVSDTTAQPKSAIAKDKGTLASSSGSSKSEVQDHNSQPVALSPLQSEAKAKIKELADNWESADSMDDDLQPSYVLPQQSDVILAVSASNEFAMRFGADAETQIVGFKRSFDEMDRNLVGVTKEWIVYITPKNIVRMIRWEDAQDFLAFEESKSDRLLSLAVSKSDRGDQRSVVMASALSGKLYISTIPDRAAEELEDALMSSFYLSPPDLPAGPSTGEIRTRAHFANKDNGIFAFTRGKTLLIKRLPDRHLQTGASTNAPMPLRCDAEGVGLTAGKAIKDFAFSPDDSVLITLDKSGKLAAWDIRNQIKLLLQERSPTMMLETPLISWIAAQTDSDMRPCSVRFMSSPWRSKSGEVRGLIVGLKNNHVIQIWNLDVGGPVVEIRLPPTTDSERLCVLDYEIESSMLIVGHPGRRSVYLIHLARFDKSQYQDQAYYLHSFKTRARNVTDTAAASNLQEFSISEVGEFQSLQVLPPTPKYSPSAAADALFSIYVLGSKAAKSYCVTSGIIGRGPGGKLLAPQDAVKSGVVKLVGHLAPIDYSAKPEPPQPEVAQTEGTPADAIAQLPEMGNTPVPTPTVSKKALKKARRQEAAQVQQAESPVKKVATTAQTNGTPAPAAKSAPTPSKKAKATPTQDTDLEPAEASGSRATPSNKVTPASQVVSSADIEKVLSSQLQTLGHELSRRMESALAGSLNGLQSQLLLSHKVNCTDQKSHSTNTIKSAMSSLNAQLKTDLKQIVEGQIQSRVMPLMSNMIRQELQAAMSTVLPQHIRTAVKETLPREMAGTAGDVIDRTMDEVAKILPDFIEGSIPRGIEATLAKPEVTAALAKATITSIADWLNSRVIEPTNKMYTDLLNAMEFQAEKTGETITKLTAHIEEQDKEFNKLSEAVRSSYKKLGELPELVAASAQDNARLRDEMLAQMRENGKQLREVKEMLSNSQNTISSRASPSARASSAPHVTHNSGSSPSKPKVETEFERRCQLVNYYIKEGRMEEAIEQWTSAKDRGLVFNSVLANHDPEPIASNLPQLALLSSLAATTEDLNDFLPAKLRYATAFTEAVRPADPQTRGVICGVLEEIMLRYEKKGTELLRRSRGADPYLRAIGEIIVLTGEKIQDHLRMTQGEEARSVLQ